MVASEMLTSGLGLKSVCTPGEFVARLGSAELLSRCAAAYPQGVQPVSWDTVMERISGMLLDVSPSCRLDEIILEAKCDGERGLPRVPLGQRILWKLGWSREARNLHKAYADIRNIVEGMSNRRQWRRRFRRDFAFLEDYLMTLFEAVACVVCVGRLSDHPVRVDVAELALNGFLPVDIEREGPNARIFVV